MKRTISWVLVMVMVLGLFAGCGAANETPAEPTNAPAEAAPTEAVVVADENLANTVEYLKAYYKNVKDGDLTPADFERLGTVRVGTTAYEVVYTVDCDESVVKIVKGENGMVLIDVNEENEDEVTYTLTATITGTDGKTASMSWTHVVPASMNSDEIVDAAYALEDGEALGYEATLTGEITSVDTPYSADYKNITVTIKVTGREDKPIQCYRLKGEGADALGVGDIITVTGTLKNYKGTIEFDAGCVLDKVEKGSNSVEVPTDPQEILEEAFSLSHGQYLPYPATLTGKIVGIRNAYSEQYGNVSVFIKTGAPSYMLMCFRMKGDGVDKIWLDDEITVTGNITNYNGTIEFDAGCQLVSWVDNPDPVAPSDPAEILKAAYTKLNHRDTLPYACGLTGTVTKIVSKWSDKYNNITVNMTVPGCEDMPVQCYRMNGAEAKNIEVGDTITVYGWLMNYNGTIEFKQGCSLWKLVKGEGGSTGGDSTLTGIAKDLEDASNLANKEYLDRTTTITGTITNNPKASSYNEGQYDFTVSDGTYEIRCYFVPVSGGTPAKGDTVTVTGNLTAYNGGPQFDSKASATLAGGSTEPEEPETPAVDANSSLEEIVEAVKAGAVLDFDYTVTGTIKAVYDNEDGTRNVPIITSAGQINCNFIPNNGADWEAMAEGDTIFVNGKVILKNGKVRVDGGTLVARTPAATEEEPAEPEVPATFAEMVAAAAGLADNEALPYSTTQTGVVQEVTYYNEKYDSYSFVLNVGGVTVEGYSLNAIDGKTIEAGDTVTVSGNLSAFKGKAQFSYKNAVITNIEKAAN